MNYNYVNILLRNNLEVFVLFNGVKLGAAFAIGTASILAIAGLATGIGIEGSKASVRERKISDLNDEINLANQVTKDINVSPQNGFINK